MIFFNAIEVIEIVHHQADRLMQSFFAEIRGPVDGAQAGTIAKMEPCDRVNGNIVGALVH